jgi:DNA-binding CsgD family transcriptional regulator
MESMLCPVLIGRSAELGILTAALDGAAEGHGAAIFVTGDAGVGKSRLTSEVARLAAERQVQVLTGRSTQAAVPVPYRPVEEALLGAARAGLSPDSSGISDYRAALGVLVPEWSRPDDGSADVTPVVVAEALLRLMTSAGRNGALLVLEDLHWADPESLAVIEYLMDNIAAANALCLFTLRDSGPSQALELMRSATARRVASRLRLPRLGQDAVWRMAAACLDVADAPVAVRRLLADCDGLPFAVEEILAAAVSSGKLARDDSGWRVDDEVPTRVPDSIAESVRSRLAALGSEVAAVLVSAAVLGRQFDSALLPAVAGVTETGSLDALRRASEVQLIEPACTDPSTFRFRHSLTRDAILADLLPPDLASRSVAAAEAIEQAHPGLPGNWCELAAELRATAGQLPAAARLLLIAGRRAVLKGAVSSAVAAMSEARELLAASATDSSALRIEVDEVLAEALYMAGDSKRLEPLANDLVTRLETAGADPRRQVLVRLRAASTRPEDNPDTAAEHLAAAGVIASRLGDGELGSRVDAVTARAALAAGELQRAEDLARRSLAAAEAAGRSGWGTEVALEALEVIGRAERARDVTAARATFERIRAIADDSALGVWQIRALHELATIDMLTGGPGGQPEGPARRDDPPIPAAELGIVRERAHQAGALCIATATELQLANLLSLGADLDQALAMARHCGRSAAQIRALRIQAMAVCLQANIAAIRGDGAAAERAAVRAEEILPGDPEILATTWGESRVLAALFADDITQAVSDSAAATAVGGRSPAEPSRSVGSYSVLQGPLLAPRRTLALNALLEVIRDPPAQDATVRAAVRLAERSGAASSWNAGLLAYAEAVLEGRHGHARRATALAEDGSARLAPFAPWWDHLVRRLVAPSALRDQWGQPARWLREAVREFDLTGHERLASACRRMLREAGEPVPRARRGTAQVPRQMRRLGITSREMDVLVLLARGHSNSEIAAKLYISPKTVETHIASLAAKTGQPGRRELAAHAASLARTAASGLR